MPDRAPCRAYIRRHAAASWRHMRPARPAWSATRSRIQSRSQLGLLFLDLTGATLLQKFAGQFAVEKGIALSQHQSEAVIGYPFGNQLLFFPGIQPRAYEERGDCRQSSEKHSEFEGNGNKRERRIVGLATDIQRPIQNRGVELE